MAKSISSGVLLCGTADVVSQRIESPTAAWDLKRTLRFMVWGAAWNGVLFHAWYQRYLPRIMDRLSSRSFVSRFPILAKILVDQALLSPVLYFAFPLFHGLAEGKDLSKIKEKTGSMWWKIAVADWTFYPTVQAVNFAFVPAMHHTLVVQASSFMFNIGMSFMNKHLDH